MARAEVPDVGSVLQVPGPAGGGPAVSGLVRWGGKWGRDSPDCLPHPYADPVTVAGATEPDAQPHQVRGTVADLGADLGADARVEPHHIVDARAEPDDLADARAEPNPLGDARAHARAHPQPLARARAHARAESHQRVTRPH
jgi:hypothetical protein